MENTPVIQPQTNKQVENTATNLVLPKIGQQLSYPLDYVTQEILRYFISTVQIEAFPVGSIFISVVSTDPSTLLGYGTWTAFGAGKTLVGIDAGQTEFDTVEETGGSKTHTLTDSELPAHTWNIQGSSGAAWGVAPGTSYETLTTGGGSHNNLQPYIVTYFWKRTA